MTRPVKRPYRSPLRDETAKHTRARIREAAARLFVAQGFVATTMRQVASAAGVAERTVYAAFPSKAELFGEVLGVAIVGDDLPVPAADRPAFRAALAERDGRRALTLAVDYSTALFERAGPLIMITVEAAGADPTMRQIADDGAHATAANFATLASALADHGALRPGLDPEQAADVLFTLMSPHVHHLLRHERGWTAARYRNWLLHILTWELLPGPDADDAGQPPEHPSGSPRHP